MKKNILRTGSAFRPLQEHRTEQRLYTALTICTAAVSCILLLFSCATQPKETAAQLIQREERMFWELRGQNGSTVYVLGTFHLGGEDLYPLQDTIPALFDAAERVVGEISTEGWLNFQDELIANLMKSISRTNGQFNDIRTFLTDGEISLLNRMLGEDVVNQMQIYDPWVLAFSISAEIYAAAGYDPACGVDMQLITHAGETGRTMEGLDSLQTQFDVMRYGTYEQQLALLKGTLDMPGNPEKIDMMVSLYEAYKNDDREGLAALMEKEKQSDTAGMGDFAQGYYKAIMDDRNSAWAEKLYAYLQEGGTTFIFAGAGHFIGEGNVFDLMKDRGYLAN